MPPIVDNQGFKSGEVKSRNRLYLALRSLDIPAVSQVLDSEIAEVLAFVDLETESDLERSGGG